MPKLLPNIKDVRSRLPTASREEQDSSQSINSTFPNATIPKKKKYFTFLGQYTLTHENDTSKFPGEGRNKALKSIT